MVFLICYEEPSEIRLLNWIFCSDTNDSNTDNPLNCVLTNEVGNISKLIISVKKSGSSYIFSIETNEPEIGYNLLIELQLRILVNFY